MIILIIILIEINNFLTIILIEINNLIINIGFIYYLISNLILTILANYIDPSSLDGERIAALILELGTLFSIVIVLLGFRKKANYKK